MPPLADIIKDVIHREACPLDFRATTAIDDLCTHWTPRLSCLMQQRDHNTSGAHRAVPDRRLGYHVTGTGALKAWARLLASTITTNNIPHQTHASTPDTRQSLWM